MAFHKISSAVYIINETLSIPLFTCIYNVHLSHRSTPPLDNLLIQCTCLASNQKWMKVIISMTTTGCTEILGHYIICQFLLATYFKKDNNLQ